MPKIPTAADAQSRRSGDGSLGLAGSDRNLAARSRRPRHSDTSLIRTSAGWAGATSTSLPSCITTSSMAYASLELVAPLLGFLPLSSASTPSNPSTSYQRCSLCNKGRRPVSCTHRLCKSCRKFWRQSCSYPSHASSSDSLSLPGSNRHASRASRPAASPQIPQSTSVLPLSELPSSASHVTQSAGSTSESSAPSTLLSSISTSSVDSGPEAGIDDPFHPYNRWGKPDPYDVVRHLTNCTEPGLAADLWYHSLDPEMDYPRLIHDEEGRLVPFDLYPKAEYLTDEQLAGLGF